MDEPITIRKTGMTIPKVTRNGQPVDISLEMISANDRSFARELPLEDTLIDISDIVDRLNRSRIEAMINDLTDAVQRSILHEYGRALPSENIFSRKDKLCLKFGGLTRSVT